MEESYETIDYDVIIIGAGIGGINAAYRLQERCSHLTYCIVEGRHEIGGTWSLFQYPGIRSDSDLYTYSFPWKPWKGKSIAQGSQILEYIKDAAAEHGIDTKIRFNTSVTGMNWSSTSKTWTLSVAANESAADSLKSRYVLMATGYYDYKEPLQAVIPGLDYFEGPVIHPQFWPQGFNHANKNIVIIGSGATAITLLPSLGKKAAHVTMLQRSATYVTSMPSESWSQKIIKAVLPAFLAYRIIRLQWILFIILFVRICRLFPRLTWAGLLLRTRMELPTRLALAPNFTPKYNPFDQNLCVCPDSDFYEAIRAGKASIKTGEISNITAKTIELKSGDEMHPDIIVTATGLKLCFGGDIKITVDGVPYVISEHHVWKGAMLDDLPNCIAMIGYFDASWTLGLDVSAQLACRLLNDMKTRRKHAVIPRCARGMKPLPFTYLNSTYVSVAESRMPKAGNRKQWLPRGNYLRELTTAWWGDVHTDLEWL